MRPSSATTSMEASDHIRRRRRQLTPENTYLIIESGGFVGPSYRLELPLPRRWFWPWRRTRSVELEPAEGQGGSWDAVMGQARAQVASVYGGKVAHAARFQVLWDGTL